MRDKSKRDEQLTERTCKLIKQGFCIYLKKKKEDWYLHAWTNIAAGWDKAQWGRLNNALEIMDLKTAFAIAPLYGCKVVSYNHSKNIEIVEKVRG